MEEIMKIEDVVYISLSDVNELERFDLSSMPRKPKWYLQLVAWILSFPELLVTRPKIRKQRMKGLKGPYILLCNHNSFVDFKVATLAVFPKRANYIVAVDGFINREKIMRNVGCLGTRKFISDSSIVRQIKHTLEKNKVISEIYPEARYSLVGTQSMLPDSLGKLCKLAKVPVVTLVSHGHHLRQPFWNLHKRKLRTSSDMTQIITGDEIKTLTVDEINKRIRQSFVYDDYKYQYNNKIIIDYIDRAKGLHKPLYMCPHCKVEFKMRSDKNKIWCEACGVSHEMDEYGQLHTTDQETIFKHIPDWFEWIREQVKNEILEDRYDVKMIVDLDFLPNSTGFYRLGKATLTHNKNGFELSGIFNGEELNVKKSVKSTFGAHIEYDYFGRGDCVSFSSTDDTYYMYPENQEYSVTKFHFAVEELFKLEREKSR